MLDAADLIAIGAPTLLEATTVAAARFDPYGRALVAQVAGLPLLFTGDDFAKTDLVAALSSR